MGVVISPHFIVAPMSAPTPQQPQQEGNNDSQQGGVKLRDVTQEMFERISAVLLHELSSNTEDYVLLERMNAVTTEKYSKMSLSAENLTTFMSQLKERYQSYRPFLEKIDQIEAGVQSLEDTVMQLDEYSKRLENKYKQLDNI